MQCFVGKPSSGKEVEEPEEVSAAHIYAKNARRAGLDLVQSSYNVARSTSCIVAKGKTALLMWTILSTNPNSSSPVTNASQIRDVWRWIRYQSSKIRCRWNREGVERVPRHVRMCAGHPPPLPDAN